MNIGLKMVVAAGVALVLVQAPVQGADDKASAPGADNKASAFKDDREKASYGIGMYFGNQIKRSNLDVDMDVVVAAMKDLLAGKEMKLTDQQGGEAIRTYQNEVRRKQAEKNKKEGTEFLEANKKKPGIKTHTVTLADGKTAEMQYKVVTEGTGAIPKSNDMVSVKYRGTLIDGKEFDNSSKRGDQPAKFPVQGVVKGWTEALQMMKVGSKWELYLPSDLAYGDGGRPGIDPGATLIFEMELVGVEAPQPPATPQPLTSDIIKVPSAEELKKGAKIEVIKPEDAARMAAEAQKAADKKDEKK